MFDGTVLLCCDHAVADGAARLDLFATRYARHLHLLPGHPARRRPHRRRPHRQRLRGDRALDLGRRRPARRDGGPHGQCRPVYFPCGTPDPDDIQGARVDLAGSAARELAEETGLALPDEAETDWVLLEGEGQLAFLRPVRFPETAARLVARIADHLGAEAEPELAGMHVVRGRDDIDAARMPGFVRAYLADAFPPAR